MAVVKRRKLALYLASIIAIIMAVLSTVDTLFLERYVRKEITELNTERYVQVANGFSTTISKIIDEYFAHLDYYVNSDVANEGTTEEIVEWLREHENNRDKDFDYVAWVDETGNFYSDIGTQTNITDRDYFQAIMAGAEFFIDNPVTSKTSGQTIVHISRPVKRNGKTIGFFCAVVGIDKMQVLLDDIKLDNNGLAMLFSGDGKLIGKVGAEDMVKIDLASEGGDQANADMQNKIGGDTQQGGNGVFWAPFPKVGMALNIYAPVPYTQWAMIVVIKEMAVIGLAKQITGFMTVFMVLLAICIIAGTAICVYKSIKPLNTVESAIKGIATGSADLTKRIDINSKNEIGGVVEGFNLFTEKLQLIVRAIKDTKNQLFEAGSELNNCTADTTSAITQIIANIESMGANISNQSNSVTETAGAVNQIASNIESLNKMIEGQASAVTQASAAVEEMIGNINSVSNMVNKMAEEFDVLQKNSTDGMKKQDDVSAKIEMIETESEALQEANAVISNIAEQTNLLAMNAAIEAAHAGEAGKGFSVVADEIRKLSETSTEQSNTIGDQLTKIIKSIKEIVEASLDSRQAFQTVSDGISQTNNLVQEITNSMQEQAEGSRQISEALNDMNNSTSEVRTSSFEMSEGNKAILVEIQKLQEATYYMKSGMEEMSVGASQINQTGASLSQISTKMDDSIRKIGKEVDQFRV